MGTLGKNNSVPVAKVLAAGSGTWHKELPFLLGLPQELSGFDLRSNTQPFTSPVKLQHCLYSGRMLHIGGIGQPDEHTGIEQIRHQS